MKFSHCLPIFFCKTFISLFLQTERRKLLFILQGVRSFYYLFSFHFKVLVIGICYMDEGWGEEENKVNFKLVMLTL